MSLTDWMRGVLGAPAPWHTTWPVATPTRLSYSSVPHPEDKGEAVFPAASPTPNGPAVPAVVLPVSEGSRVGGAAVEETPAAPDDHVSDIQRHLLTRAILYTPSAKKQWLKITREDAAAIADTVIRIGWRP